MVADLCIPNSDVCTYLGGFLLFFLQHHALICFFLCFFRTTLDLVPASRIALFSICTGVFSVTLVGGIREKLVGQADVRRATPRFPAPAEGLEVAAVSDAIISRGRIMIVKTGKAIPLDYRTAGRDLAAPNFFYRPYTFNKKERKM
jgi:hypothetical protein